jgi:hypothetical protein
MSDSISTYQRAMQKYESARKAADELAKKITEAADMLTFGKWTQVVMSGWKESYPPELLSIPYPSIIDSNQWPTAEQLHKTLIEWHQAEFDLKTAFEALPENQRSALKHPPN